MGTDQNAIGFSFFFFFFFLATFGPKCLLKPQADVDQRRRLQPTAATRLCFALLNAIQLPGAVMRLREPLGIYSGVKTLRRGRFKNIGGGRRPRSLARALVTALLNTAAAVVIATLWLTSWRLCFWPQQLRFVSR